MNTTIYLRKEPTDSTSLRHLTPKQIATCQDVQAYADEKATFKKGRWSWYYSNKPTRRNRYAMLNCFRWNVVWLPDLKAA